MRKTNRPRHHATQPTDAETTSHHSTMGDSKPPATEMFNILLALEAARGLLTVRDVAALFGRSTFSIYRMAEQRKIPSLMIGGSRLFDPSVLALWLSKKEPTLAVAARRIKAA
jgi:excisionase family DNA binding protein